MNICNIKKSTIKYVVVVHFRMDRVVHATKLTLKLILNIEKF